MESRRILVYFILIISLLGCSVVKKDKPVTGIGISVIYDSASTLPYINEIISSSPAAMDGLRSGDYIVKVGDEDMHFKSANYVLQKLVGHRGTPLNLSLKRGINTYSVNLVRAKIYVPQIMENLCFAIEEQITNPKKKLNPKVLPGFESINYSEDSLKNVYYRCKDTIQARRQFEKLIDMTKNCLVFTVADSISTKRTYLGDGQECVIFNIERNNSKYPALKGNIIRLEYSKNLPLISMFTIQ